LRKREDWRRRFRTRRCTRTCYGLNNATLPYMVKLANFGAVEAVKRDPALAKGVNTFKGEITYPAVAEAFGLPWKSLEELL
jgi:alanine dehydrogenase